MRAQRTAWLARHALGRVFVTVHEHSAEVAAHIQELSELALFARYEWYPLSRRSRLEPEVGPQCCQSGSFSHGLG